MELETFDLGLIDFKQALDFQKEIFTKVKSNAITSALILCRHHPVFTCGRKASRDNVLVSKERLVKKGIRLYEIERGGDLTYHGPGQLTVYPILNLAYFKRDIHWFLRQLEIVILESLSIFGVKAQRLAGLTGVWIGGRKIASIGIAIRNWITFHGLSINIKKDDLDNFHLIRPCGMDIEMTSIESELGRSVEIEDVKASIINLSHLVGGKLPAYEVGKEEARWQR